MKSTTDQLALLAFYIVAYGGLIKSLLNLYFNAIAKHWQQVEVKILESQITLNDNDSYVVKVDYSYQFKGHNYRSNRIAFGYETNSMFKIARFLVKKFEKGKRVKAYINPKKPRVAVLIAGIRYFHLLNVGIFLILAIVLSYFKS